MVYAVLLGEERGPRLGSFIALYGLEETRALIARALAGELVRGQAVVAGTFKRLATTGQGRVRLPSRQIDAMLRFPR